MSAVENWSRDYEREELSSVAYAWENSETGATVEVADAPENVRTGEDGGEPAKYEVRSQNPDESITLTNNKERGRSAAVDWMERHKGGQQIHYIDPYSFKDDTIMPEKAMEMFPSIEPVFEDLSDKRVSGGDPLSPLRSTGYKPIAYTPPVKYAYYNESKDLLVTATEGDIKVVENPTDDYIDDLLSYYPKAEVTGYGEKFDSRFPNRG
jgi:hypothetical protein